MDLTRNPVDSKPLTRYAGAMGRWLLLLLGLIIAGALPALGQGSASSGSGVSYVSTAPSGACTAGSIMQVLTTGAGTVYACQSISAGAGTWTALGSTGSTGTVTNVTVQGTASQITVTGGCAITTTGTCVLSLPSAITLPGSLSLPGQLTSTETTGTAPFVVASTTAVTNLNASLLLGATWVSPGAIGSTTASTGAFTTLSASSTVSGTGFSTYLASPPAIGGTSAAAGTFSALTDTAMTGGPFCVHETSGVLSATAADCGVGGGTFSGLNTTGASGTNTNANPIAISPGSALGGSTADFSVLGATSDTNTASVVNIDTPSGSQQNSFRAGIDGVSQLQVCWQPGPQGETVFGSAVACSGIYTTSYAKNIFQSVTGVHTLIRGWQGSASQTGPFVQLNSATAAGTGFAFLQGWTGVTGTDTYHTGGTESLVIQGDGSYIMGGCGAGTFLKADGSGCAVPSGSGTVGSGTANQITYYATTGAAVAGDAAFTDNGTTVATTDSGGFTANSFNSPSTTAPFLATSPIPSGPCTPVATQSLLTVSSDGNWYVSNNGGTCYQLDTSNTVIPTTNGGTGQNFGSSTGVLQLSSGAASVSTALANGTTATTQSAADNTTKVATDAFVIANSITNPCSGAGVGSLIYQGASGVACLAAPTSPTGVANIVYEVPGSPPSFGPAGVAVDAQSSSTPSLSTGDRGEMVQTTNNTTSTAFSVSSPTTGGYGQSFPFVWMNTGSVAGTATTSSSTVNGNATLKMVGAVAGHNPEASFWYTDNSNWWSMVVLPTDANGQLAAEGIANGSIVNAALAHAATTVQGQTCTLGLTCNINSVTTAHGVALNEGASTQLGGTAAGTSNTVLHGNTGADPTFSAVSLTANVTGVLPLANMSQLFVTNAQTTTYQVVAADFAGCKTIPVSSGTFTITLVASGSQPASGQCIWVVNYGTGTPTIARSGQTINGAAANITLAAGSASAPTGAFIVSDGTNYEAQIIGAGSGSAVTSVANSDSTLTISPTTGAVVASLNLGHANTWSTLQTFGSAGAASTPGLTVSGAPYTGGSATTNFPQFYINDGTGPTTFSTAGTEFGINTPSGFTGNLQDFHINGGSSVWSVNYQGNLALAGTIASGTAPTVTTPGTGFYVFGTEGTEPASIASGTTGFVMDSTSHCPIVWNNASNVGCVAAVGAAQTFTAAKTFTNSDLLLLGSSTGATTFTSANASATNYTLTIPANTGTVAELNLAETFSAVQTFGTNISIGGQTATGATGTGNVVFSASPSLTGTVAVGASGSAGAITLGNATSGLLTLQTATGAITSYALDLPVAQPSGSNTYLSCTAANPAVCTWAAGGGGGVTSIATTSPITGGTITTTGTIACATCATTTNGGAISFDKSNTGLINPTADATFTYVAASTSGLTIAGTAPASVSTSTGTTATTLFNVNGVAGGATSNATGTGGVGSAPTIASGTGGAGTGTNAVGGAGGNLSLTSGAGGASNGTGANSNGGNIIASLGIAGIGGTGASGVSGEFEITGTQPASSSTLAGLNVGTIFGVLGVSGGNTTHATSAGGIGSNVSVLGGNGGAGNTSGAGGAGGTITETTGTGGTAGTTGAGGAGGAFTLSTGAGAIGGTTSGTGGNGGALGITGGNGGNQTVSGNGGNGSTITLTAGNGGNGATTGGNGGNIVLTPGSVGTGGTPTAGLVQISTGILELGTNSCSFAGTGFGICGTEGTAFTNASGDGGLYFDSTAHEIIVKTNGASSGGILQRTQPGAIRSTGLVAAVTTATLCAAAAGACNVAGTYAIDVALYQSGTACSANTSGGVAPSLTWTDANGTAHSAQGIPLDTNASLTAVSGTMLWNATTLGAWGSGHMVIDTNGSVIQYAIAFTQCGTGTATYAASLTATRLQ